MKRSDSFVMHVDMLNGSPIGEGVERLQKVISAYKQVEAMTGKKYRLRFTAHGKRGVRLADCAKAAIYIYLVKAK